MKFEKKIANRLTSVTIKFVSLVPAGANRREFVAKGEGEAPAIDLEVPILKVDEDKRIVTGVLYPAGEVDTQGDFITEADLDAAMEDFMAKGRSASGVACDTDHDEHPTADYITECYKVEEGDPRWEEKDIGAWVVSRKIVEDELWSAVKDGKYKAFSFSGIAKRIPDVEVTKAIETRRIAAIKEATSEALRKGKLAEQLERMRVPTLIDATASALWQAYSDSPANSGEEKAALREVIEEALTYFKTNERKNKFARIVDVLLDADPAKSTDDTTDPPAESGGEPPVEEPPTVIDEEEVARQVQEALAAAAEKSAATEADLRARIDELEKASPGTGRADVIVGPGAGTEEEEFHYA